MPGVQVHAPILTQIVEKYKNDLQLAYRNFPLPQHENAKQAAIAAQAAGVQGKFWEYADVLYSNQDNLSKEELIKYAETVGMNVEKFKKDLEDPVYATQVQDDLNVGYKIGIGGTPTFILNNIMMDFETLDDFESQIAEAIKNAGGTVSQVTQKEEPAPETTQSTELDTKNIKASTDVVTIEYTKDGFVPNNLKLTLGQRVRFVNTTDKPMVIRQLIKKYGFFMSPMTLEPNAEFHFILTEPDLWTFKEDSVRHYGSIFVANE